MSFIFSSPVREKLDKYNIPTAGISKISYPIHVKFEDQIKNKNNNNEKIKPKLSCICYNKKVINTNLTRDQENFINKILNDCNKSDRNVFINILTGNFT